MQVQAAMREDSGATASRANGHAASSGSSPAVLAEGSETALLYVRFRAAAEPGLKGEPF